MLRFSEFITERSINVNMNHRQISDHLKGLGWQNERTQGPHDIWGHPKATHKIAVPRHKGDLAPGTVRSIVNKSRDINS